MLTTEDDSRSGDERIPATVKQYGPISFIAVTMNGDGTEGSKGGELRASGFVLVGRGDLANSNRGLVRSKAEVGTGLVVGPALEGKPVEGLFGEGDGGEPVAGAVEVCHHGAEAMTIAPKCNLGGDLHGLILSYFSFRSKGKGQL